MKFLIILLTTIILNISFSKAESGNGICESFADNSSTWGACSDAPNITSSVIPTGGPDGKESFLQIVDGSGGSALCSGSGFQGGGQSPYVGDWTKLSGSCKQFCFDVRLIRGGAGVTSFNPYINIESGSSTFAFRSNKTITTDGGNNPGWHRICPPIATINNGDSLPSNAEGRWEMLIGNSWSNAYTPLWNAGITSVENLVLPVDFTSSPSEIIGYDNLCLGDCPDVDPACSPFNGSRLASLLEMTPGNPLSNPYLLKVNPNLDSQLNDDMQGYIDLHANNGHGANSLVVLTEVFDSTPAKISEGYHCWTSGIASNPACKEFSPPPPTSQLYNLLPDGFQEGETYKLKTFVFLEGAGTGWVTNYIPPHCDRSNTLEFNWTFGLAARTSGKATFDLYDQSKKLIRKIPVK